MKNSGLFYLLLIFTSALFLNCSSDDLDPINNEKLHGIWFENFIIEDENQILRLEYQFNEDDTYEILRIRIDNTNGDILGYQYRELGNFSLRGNTLFFKVKEKYISNNQEEFSDLENLQLVSSNSNAIISKKIEFRDNERILAFIPPPCPDNASCLKPPVLEKQ